ncbi:hypothetical protein ED733_000849 [Metarhizium rileyi]|nr:hypothetical protein ED733_000849 [Metarhizium rileyi]
MELMAFMALLLPFVYGLSIQERQAGSPRTVRLPLHRAQIRDPIAYDRSRMRKRAGSINATVDNLETLYFLNVTLGTPPQQVRLHVDTGSSDMWVNTPGSEFCSLEGEPCAEARTYTANSSSTYEYVNSKFSISYVDKSSSAGDYAKDTIRLSGVNISSFQFGIGYRSTSDQNILGLGYPSNEVQVVRAGLSPYQNLPAKMAADGLIASKAYSLWLNDLSSAAGAVLFGGLDMDRFQGKLVTVPIQKVNNAYNQFYITMTGLDYESTAIAKDMALAVLLDSGSSLTYLPDPIVKKIHKMTDALVDPAGGYAYVPCSLGDNGTMTFKFSSPASITVPLDEMTIRLSDRAGKPLNLADGRPACLLGILPAGSSSCVLGDTFLRSAYVVYDMDNNGISLANTKFNATTSNIVEIQGGSAIPSATKASNPVTATSGITTGSSGDGSGQKEDNEASGLAPSLAMILVCLVAGSLI